MVFEDVVFDNDRFGIDATITTTYNRVTRLLLSNTTSSNTTSLNSRVIVKLIENINTNNKKPIKQLIAVISVLLLLAIQTYYTKTRHRHNITN